MILSSGVSVCLININQVAKAKQNSAVNTVKTIALGITAQINFLTDSLEKMAQDPEVLAAVTSADQSQLTAAAEKLERYLPGILKVRLLLPEISGFEDHSTPKMGYSDLDMVKETFINNQLPAIQGDNGADRHLAITRRIIQNEQVVGIILASFNYDFISNILQAAELKDGYIELRQATLVLATAGDPVQAEQSDNAQINVNNSRWSLYYQYIASGNFVDLTVTIGIIAISILLMLLAFFMGYRKLSYLLRQDLVCILRAFKDIMANKLQGTYPVNLPDMNTVISTLMQYKWIMDNQGLDSASQVDLDRSRFSNESADHLSLGGTTPWPGKLERKPTSVADTSNIALKVIDLEGAGTQIENISFNKSAMKENLLVDCPVCVPDGFETSPSLKMTALIFKAYDIRGIVGKTLNNAIVYDIGRALGTQTKNQYCKTIVVGRDGRASSPALAEALIQGLISTGLNVLDIGMVPTPLLYFVAKHTEGRSGVMITGSHNPADYNGLKMVIDDVTLSRERIQQLKTCIENSGYTADKSGNVEQNKQLHNEYLSVITEHISLDRPLTVVLDCGNGVAGELGPILLRALGCEVIELFCDIDGTFPNHHPDPSDPKNLTDLIESVKHYQADIGIAFDGDGDRLGVIDSNGKIIWPDRQMMLFSKNVLTGNPGAQILYDVRSTRHLAEQITKFGGRPLMWKIGHSLIKAKLKETGAKLAGEMSGHIFFNDRWFGFDDALYAASRLLEILSKDSRSSADVFADFPDSINTPELNIALEEGENFAFMDSLLATADFPDGKICGIDGMRVDFPDGWGLVRASNTTPSLAIRFEADTGAAMLRIQRQFRQLMKKIKPEMVLPF
jgi:phosphomannomutase/phosphoglucomutase